MTSDNKTVFYVAARRQDPAKNVRAMIQSHGQVCNATWIDASDFGTGTQDFVVRRKAAVACREESSACDELVIIAEPDLAPCKGGKHAETGIAIGLGKRVHLIGQREHILHWLPEVIVHDDNVAFAAYLCTRFGASTKQASPAETELAVHGL